ncbi:uncharacterized protein C20orf173 homolog isoform X2 [Canis aureus]
MKHLWQIFVLWVFWVLIMWLMAPCLDPKPESPPQGKLMALVPRHCNCPWLKFRRSGCPSETLNASLSYQRVGERNRFATCYEKALEHLMGATESMTPDTVLWWLSRYPAPSPQSSFCCFQGMNSASGLGKMWEKLFKVIPRPSASHFHIYCGTCALMGHSQTLWGPGLTSNVHQPTAAFVMNEGCVQGFETVGNQATGHFIHPGNASNQGSWRKLLLLLLQFPGLVWTSDAPLEEDACFRFGSEKQEEGYQDWEGVNWTKSTKEILCAARKQEWKSATVWRVNSLSTPDTDQSPHKS